MCCEHVKRLGTKTDIGFVNYYICMLVVKAGGYDFSISHKHSDHSFVSNYADYYGCLASSDRTAREQNN